MSRHLLLLSALSFLLISCNFSPDESEDAVPPPPEVSLSDDKLVELGFAIQDEFNEGNSERFDASFDPAMFFSRILWPHAPSDRETAEFIGEVEDKVKGSGSWIGGDLARQFHSTGTVYFVRVARDKEGTRLLFRVNGTNGTLNYLEFLVAEKDNGEPVLVDMYSAASGENLSNTLRRLYLGSGDNVITRLLNKGNTVTDQTLVASQKMKSLIAEGKYEEALSHFNTLPKNVQRQKSLQLVRVRAAMESEDDERYAAAVKELLDLYPNDLGMDLIQGDYFFIRKEFDSVLAAYDRLDKRVRDPYLDYQRACAYLEKGDLERATQLAKAVIGWDSTLIEPHYVLISVAQKKKDNAAIAAALEGLQQSGAGEIDFEGLEASEYYTDFIRSNEYAALERKYR